jgi:hypothetical protein
VGVEKTTVCVAGGDVEGVSELTSRYFFVYCVIIDRHLIFENIKILLSNASFFLMILNIYEE